MTPPRISLITITRNNADGLRRTIESVAGQDTQPMEHIIVDGMSIDHTPLILEHAAKNVLVIKAEPRGVYHAINTGIERATGDVIGLLHAGDVFSSGNVLSCVSDMFACAQAPDFIFGDVHFANPRSGHVTRYYSADGFSPSDIADGFSPPHPSLYMTAQACRHIGPYKTHYRVSADFEMFVRLFNDNTLTWRYMPVDMVTMSTGGLSSKLIHRLYTHNRERMTAFRENGIKSSYMRICKHYIKVLKSYICTTNRH